MTSLFLNMLFLIHYAVETYYFWALRTEFITIMVIMLILNAFWTIREYFQRSFKTLVKKE
jgi:hypothetical protein